MWKLQTCVSSPGPESPLMRDIRLAVFDFDNTLWENVGAHDRAFMGLVCDLSASSGISQMDIINGMQSVFAEHATMFQYPCAIPCHPALKAAHPGEDLVQRYALEVEVFEKLLQSFVKPYDGIFLLLEGLRARGVRLACYSDASASRVFRQMEELGIGHLFDLVCAADEEDAPFCPDEPVRYVSLEGTCSFARRMAVNTEHGPKSHLEILQAILAEMKVRPDQAVMVGDHPIRDVAMARKCGVVGIYAAWGRKILERLEVLDKVHPYFMRMCAEAKTLSKVDAEFVAEYPESILDFLFGDAS
ncbi:MAG: hypothetical protein A2018_05210 [Alphaproteobacteria bacterium GWF2_58_20]|nr:MAG: hypothetical protein A2018_05210 [Alphaproteobacteria bacterium GWF2_58_20]